MFDEVTKREGGKRAARKGAYLFGSTAFQVAFIAGLIVASERIRAHVAEGPVVDVKFVKQSAPPPPPPPPAPPRPKRPPNAPKPPPDAPKAVPPPPQAMIQPKEVQEEIKMPTTPPEPVPDYGGDEGDGDDGGVVGGVVGAGGGIEEAPQYMTAGFLAPRERSKGCVSQSVRLPPELRGYVKSVIAKFGVKPNGQPYAFSLLGEIPQEIRSRMESAVWQAVASCDWAAGADAQGKPIAIYVMLPLRFAQ